MEMKVKKINSLNVVFAKNYSKRKDIYRNICIRIRKNANVNIAELHLVFPSALKRHEREAHGLQTVRQTSNSLAKTSTKKTCNSSHDHVQATTMETCFLSTLPKPV